MSTATLTTSAARIASAARTGDYSGLTAAEAHAARLVASAPPLTASQRSLLAATIGGAR